MKGDFFYRDIEKIDRYRLYYRLGFDRENLAGKFFLRDDLK